MIVVVPISIAFHVTAVGHGGTERVWPGGGSEAPHPRPYVSSYASPPSGNSRVIPL